ncbi:MAG: uroporphyrinogen-III C-methyltransferase [Deltaproteobacteria bacterium]|nr:uroporphyrinogen-III C-methyltransferase [Deltaproteobacteria bacterium]MBN2671004.1 uroporphyrinogen-III C-methyltransferase [Deltaproteobacteria bacterium]
MIEYKTLPISLVLPKHPVALVVGGGAVALQKIQWLRQFDMQVEVHSVSLCAPLAALWNAGDVEWVETEYTFLEKSYALVISATNDEEVNYRVFRDATERHIPVNVVDQPAWCTFFVPSVVKKGDVVAAVSTQGAAPALAGAVRRQLQSFLPDSLAAYAELLKEARVQLRSFPRDRRMKVNRALVASYRFSQFDRTAIDKRVELFWAGFHALVRDVENDSMVGHVYLVGAGPGDVGLLTVAGLRAIAGADAILHDGLVNPAMLSNVDAREKELFDTSKRAGCRLHRQEDINALMVQLALEGKIVCRLKGGDPCVFGRVTEEMRALREAQVPYEIISGVTSAVAALAYAGIPVTDRHCASFFQVVTGHEAPSKTESRINWAGIADSAGTVVFLMGAHRLSEIAQKLIQHGKPGHCPVALISRGTLPEQTVYETTVAEAANCESSAYSEFPRPVLIVVGDVVSLRRELQWFPEAPGL